MKGSFYVAIYQRCVLLHFCQGGCNTEHVGEINVELHRRRKGLYFSDDVDKKTVPKKFKLEDISHRLSPSSPWTVTVRSKISFFTYTIVVWILDQDVLHISNYTAPFLEAQNKICQTSDNQVGSTNPTLPKRLRAATIVISKKTVLRLHEYSESGSDK